MIKIVNKVINIRAVIEINPKSKNIIDSSADIVIYSIGTVNLLSHAFNFFNLCSNISAYLRLT